MQQLIPCPLCAAPVSAASALCSSCGCRFHKGSVGLEPDGMTCFKCGMQSDGMSRSCPGCGAPYYVECPQCGHEYPPNERFCPQCRADRLAASTEEAAAERPVTSLAGRMKLGRILVVLFFLAPLYFFYGYNPIVWIVSIALFLLLIVGVAVIARADKRGGGRIKPLATQNLVEVYQCYDLANADHLVGLLESEGIPAHNYCRNLSSLGYTLACQGYRVLVPAERVAEARELMAAFDFESGLDLDSVQADETFDQATRRGRE